MSIATVPEGHRSSPITPRPLPGGSSTLGRSLMFECERQSILTQPDDPLLPAVVKHDDTQPNEHNDNGQSSIPVQGSFVIHLQDPVELLPNVVNIDSD